MSGAKIAIKYLTASDLSFFKVHLERSKQKAINLNSDVFIEQFYPGLRESFSAVFFPLVVIGPGGRAAHRLARKALRSPGAKNWRLNGEFIHDPDNETGRYDELSVGDFAIVSFEGTERPEAVTLILVSAREDPELHAAIVARCEFAGRNTMASVSESLVAELRAATGGAYPGEHPLDALDVRDTIEEVLFGSASPALQQIRPTSGRSVTMSPEALRRQLLAAEETGHRGEGLFGEWLIAAGHQDDDFEWVSQTHARSSFDYEVFVAKWTAGMSHMFIEVKTTRGPFERPVHMSISELRFAASVENYRIARIYDVDGKPAKLKMLAGVQVVAASIIESLGTLPAGVVAESMQIDPGVFEIELEAVLT